MTDGIEFTQHYLSASRLHFIGTWKWRFERMKRSLRALKPRLTDVGPPYFFVHVDMDCFFVSVARLANKDLLGLPVAVCSSTDAQLRANSKAELSSVSYEARKFGVRAGMWLNEAKKRCPKLVCVGFDFAGYTRASSQVYRACFEWTHDVLAKSCDECYLRVSHTALRHSSLEIDDVVRQLRARIAELSGCQASAGVGESILQARMATRLAKPNGQRRIASHVPLGANVSVERYTDVSFDEAAVLNTEQWHKLLLETTLRDVPGVGYKTRKRLQVALQSAKYCVCVCVCVCV
ncbi:MAG: hypothetical protein MHM6MM_009535, partial [Cercozoa sp. M6MM]